MINRRSDEETREYQGWSIRIALVGERPKGMSPHRYLEVVWLNFCDCFASRIDFYQKVASGLTLSESTRVREDHREAARQVVEQTKKVL